MLQLLVSFSSEPLLPLPSESRHVSPPFDAGGSLHKRVLVCSPPPHDLLQESYDDHCPQFPFTAAEMKDDFLLNYLFYLLLVSWRENTTNSLHSMRIK